MADVSDPRRESMERVIEVSRRLLELERRPVPRDQHPKQHGCVRAKFVIRRGLEENLRKGLFEEERAYDAWIRFSNGAQRDDTRPDVHGMAVKLTRLKLFLLVAVTTALVMVVALVELKRPVLTAREVLVLEGQTGDSEATFAAFSPDGTRLAVGGHGHARVWDLASRKPLVSVDTWDENIALSPDGTRLATAGGGSGLVQVWDAIGGKVLLAIETDFNVADVVFSPDGLRLAAGGMTGLKLWDGATGRELAGLPTRARMVNSVAFSPDGKLLAAGGS